MTEVSACEMTVKEGRRVGKGDEIGVFRYGGGARCVLFREGVELDEFPQVGQDHNVPVRARLAVVKKSN